MKNPKSDRERRAMFAQMNGAKCQENKFSYAPVYAAGDIGAMGVDAVGTAGATVVGAVPLLVGLGVGYVGADLILRGKERLQDKYEKEKSYSQRLIEKQKTRTKKNRYSLAPVEELTYLDQDYEIPDR